MNDNRIRLLLENSHCKRSGSRLAIDGDDKVRERKHGWSQTYVIKERRNAATQTTPEKTVDRLSTVRGGAWWPGAQLASRRLLGPTSIVGRAQLHPRPLNGDIFGATYCNCTSIKQELPIINTFLLTLA